MVSCFDDIFFYLLSWNLTQYLLLPTTSCTTPVIYFLNLLENPFLISSYISPTLAFTIVPTIILFALPSFLVFRGRLVVSEAVWI